MVIVLLYDITVFGYSLKMGISWLYVYYVVFGYVPTMGLSQSVYVFCSFSHCGAGLYLIMVQSAVYTMCF